MHPSSRLPCGCSDKIEVEAVLWHCQRHDELQGLLQRIDWGAETVLASSRVTVGDRDRRALGNQLSNYLKWSVHYWLAPGVPDGVDWPTILPGARMRLLTRDDEGSPEKRWHTLRLF